MLAFPTISKSQASKRGSPCYGQDLFAHPRSFRLTFLKIRFISKIFQPTFRLPLFKILSPKLTFSPALSPVIVTLWVFGFLGSS